LKENSNNEKLNQLYLFWDEHYFKQQVGYKETQPVNLKWHRLVLVSIHVYE